VDKVIGLALEDLAAENEFRKFFNPKFTIKNYHPKELFRLTQSFPQVYYIKNDSIVLKLSGELPSAYVFKKDFEKRELDIKHK
jgi:hypothetical protein